MRKVAIVGSCPSSRLLAPYRDESWEIWGFSPDNLNILPRMTVWFEVHGDWGWTGYDPTLEQNYIAWVNTLPCQVYAQRQDIFPKAELFPAEKLVEKFGPYWFTSTVAWMLAFALENGVTELSIYGCDMALKDEYDHQLPACHRFLEIATDRGVPVYVPPESDLLNPPPLYGYSITTPLGRKTEVRHRELRGRIKNLDKQISELTQQRTHLIGAMDGNEYIQARWLNPHKEAPIKEK